MSVWVTPSILAGPEDCTTNIATVRCETAQDAVRAIEAGKVAWIPVDPWDDIVYETMLSLGATPAWSRREIHAARHGTVLPEAAFHTS